MLFNNKLSAYVYFRKAISKFNELVSEKMLEYSRKKFENCKDLEFWLLELGERYVIDLVSLPDMNSKTENIKEFDIRETQNDKDGKEFEVIEEEVEEFKSLEGLEKNENEPLSQKSQQSQPRFNVLEQFAEQITQKEQKDKNNFGFTDKEIKLIKENQVKEITLKGSIKTAEESKFCIWCNLYKYFI